MRIALLLLLAASSPAPAVLSLGRPVANAELARMRGGFSLPNGVDVSLAVQSQTAVDGAIVLRSIFKAEAGAPELAVYVPRTAPVASRAAGATAVSSASKSAALTPGIGLDAMGNLVVTPGRSGGGVTVNVGSATPQPVVGGEGLEQLQIVAGQMIDTAGGTVSRTAGGGVDRVELHTDTLDTIHFFGSSFGFLTANTASDRAIDTSTTINVTLGNAGPDVAGSAVLRAEGLALDSARMLSR